MMDILIGTILFAIFVIVVFRHEKGLKDFERRLKKSVEDGTVLNYNSPEELKKDKKYDVKK